MPPLDRLLAIMAQLRDPQSGCDWDKAQTFETIAPYTIEEAYEVADAIVRQDIAALKDELGDLLLQVVFHSRIAEEAGHFAFADVAAAFPHCRGSRPLCLCRCRGRDLGKDGNAASAYLWRCYG